MDNFSNHRPEGRGGSRPAPEIVRQWAEDHIEDIADEALGDPNRRLSNRRTKRWGSKGSLALEIDDGKRGLWFDHEAGVGGDAIDLIAHLRGMSRADAWGWACGMVGGDYRPDPARRQARQKMAQADRDREKAEKLERARTILDSVGPIIGTPAETYWTEGRAIPRMAPCLAWRPRAFGPHGALVVTATDRNGIATGGQEIYLDAQGRKAPVNVPKRSFGLIKGSAAVMYRRLDAILPP